MANFVKTTCVSRTQTRHTTAHSPGGGLPPSDLHFRKTLVELMLSSNRHVTLRLTVFQIPGIWFLAGQNSRFLGSPGVGYPPREDLQPGTGMYHHANFHADRHDISVPGQNTHFSLQGLSWGLPSHAIDF